MQALFLSQSWISIELLHKHYVQKGRGTVRLFSLIENTDFHRVDLLVYHGMKTSSIGHFRQVISALKTLLVFI